MVKRQRLALKIDRWDSDFFKKRIARMEITERGGLTFFSESLSELLKKARREKVHSIIIKLQGSDPKIARGLIKAGFKGYGESVDLRLTYPSAVRKKESNEYEIRPVRRKDSPSVCAIAKDAFRLSYLYRCGLGKKEEVDRYHSIWAENLIKNKDVEVFVAERKGKVVGFTTLGLNIRKREGRIGLIAVDKRFRGRGIGSLLVNRCIESGRGRLKTLFVKTQSKNKAVSLYKKRGFTVFMYDKIFCKNVGDRPSGREQRKR